MATPFVAVHLEAVGSTQDEARSRFEGRPVLVTAGHQTEGRGRSGNSWRNADRALAASLAFAPEWPRSTWPRIGLVSGLAARDATHPSTALKWPNDLVIGETKVAGLLAEASDDLVVLGMGVNLYWERPIEGAGALYPEDPGATAGLDLAVAWATSVLRRVAVGPGDWGRSDYEAACVTVGRRIVWDPGGEGVAVGIADDGGLVVDTPTGRVTIHDATVSRVRAR